MNSEEFKLQVYANAYLSGTVIKGNKRITVNSPFPDLLYFHVANQRRTESEAAMLKMMGVKAGVFDFICFWNGSPGKGAIEMKRPDGYLSAAQKDFKVRFEKSGGITAECRSVAEVRDTLISWGIKCINTTCFEPDLRTDAQKKRDAFNFYAPSKKNDS